MYVPLDVDSQSQKHPSFMQTDMHQSEDSQHVAASGNFHRCLDRNGDYVNQNPLKWDGYTTLMVITKSTSGLDSKCVEYLTKERPAHRPLACANLPMASKHCDNDQMHSGHCLLIAVATC